MGSAPDEMEQAYRAEVFTLEHHEQMDTLFRSAFGSGLSKKSFLKRYDTVSLGAGVIGFIAIHRQTGEAAAYYGVFPVQLEWKGRRFLAAQSGDTMTHAAHRKKGLFIWLAQKTYEVCIRKGVELVFGLPNENSYPGFINRLGWQQTDRVIRYDCKLAIKTLPLPKWSHRLSCFSAYRSYARRMLPAVATKMDAFSNPLPTTDAKVVRDRAYLLYKEEADKYFIRIEDVLFWIKLSDVLWIGEISNYAAVTGSVVRKLKQLAFRLGYNTISFHLNEKMEAPFLQYFKSYQASPSCFLDLNGQHEGFNLLLTAADFDTW